MAARIVFYHLTGGNLTQVGEFAVDADTDITIGRDLGSTVRFDQADDAGSGHCRIRIAGEPPCVWLSNCGGGDGTLVNGRRIETEIEVSPGDEIELGPGGPKFAFDWAAMPGAQSPRKVRLPVGGTAAHNAVVPVPAIAALPAVQHAARPRNRWAVYAALSGLVLSVVAAGTAYRMSLPTTLAQAPAQATAGTAEATPVISPTPASTALAPDDKSDVETRTARPAGSAATVAALPSEPPRSRATADRKPDLAGTVRKIAGASRFQVRDQWIELYGVDDPTTKGEHNQAVYEYLKPFSGAIECYGRAYGRFECFGGGQNLAIIAIRRGFVQLTTDAPSEYYALLRRLAAER